MNSIGGSVKVDAFYQGHLLLFYFRWTITYTPELNPLNFRSGRLTNLKFSIASMGFVAEYFKLIVKPAILCPDASVCLTLYVCTYMFLTPWELHLEYYKLSLTPSFVNNCFINCSEMKESTSFVIKIRKFVSSVYTVHGTYPS